jgi:glyoxylase-like metal-dependent hydrolase (beta-lactamase superfamily II)
MEFADLEKRPEKAPEPPMWESLQSDDLDQETVIPGHGGDYGKNVPGLQMFNLHELPTSAPSREQVESRANESRIAQSLAEESGVR